MRRQDIDILKGLAIIAVVLYHAGFLSTGYLGVDVFLVISGFLTIPSVVKKVAGEGSGGGILGLLPTVSYA